MEANLACMNFLLTKLCLQNMELEKKIQTLKKHTMTQEECLVLSRAERNIVDRKVEEFLRKKNWKVLLGDSIEGKVLADICLD